MKAQFLPEAEMEFREAVRYYEREASGVGFRFIMEVRRGFAFIAENPYSAPDVGNGIRRRILNHFPYNLLYAIESDSIVIIAVAHQRRRPQYWRGRVEELRKGIDQSED